MALVMLFCVGWGSLAAAQTVGPNSLLENKTPQELNDAAEFYESFLRQPPETASPEAVLEAQTRLGTVYLLLHRYEDSLHALVSVSPDFSSKNSMEKPDVGGPKGTALSIDAQVWLVRGLDYLELEQLPRAIAALRRAVEIQPQSATARLALGDALARSNHLAEAVKEYERQTRETPTLPDAWYKLGLAHSFIAKQESALGSAERAGVVLRQLQAERLLGQAQYLDAARTLLRLIRESPDQPGLHADLGRALLEVGYWKAAEDQLKKELAIDPLNPSARLDLAQTAALHANWNEVGSQLTAVSEVQPRELTRLLEMLPAGPVRQAWIEGRIRPSPEFGATSAGALWRSWMDESLLIEVKGNGNAAAPACSAIPRADLRPGTWLSEPCYRELIKSFAASNHLPTSEKVKLAEAQYRLAHYDQALQTAQSILHASAANEWGTYWFRNAHRSLAQQCFLRVADLDPNSVRAHQMLAQDYAAWLEYPKARAEYQAAIAIAPQQADLHLGLGTVYWRTHNFADAEKELKIALELAPESAVARYELGDTYAEQSEWQQAIEQLRKVPSDSSVVLQVRLDLAKAEDALGKTTEALQDLQSVESLDQDGQVHYRLASLYSMSGDTAHAHEALEKFKQLRAAALKDDKDELGALEEEQAANGSLTKQQP